MTIRDWAIHYNRGRPHSALGPGLPEPMSDQVPSDEHRHRLPVGYRVVKRSILGGFYEKVVKVKADVAAILKFFLPIPQLEADPTTRPRWYPSGGCARGVSALR